MEVTDERVKKIEDQLKLMNTQRITQGQIVPDAVKSRHIGEGVRFIRAGLEADLPTSGEDVLQGQPLYWCTDTFKLKIWTGSAWKSVTLS